MSNNVIIDPHILMKSDLTENFNWLLSNTVPAVRKIHLSICRAIFCTHKLMGENACLMTIAFTTVPHTSGCSMKAR